LLHIHSSVTHQAIYSDSETKSNQLATYKYREKPCATKQGSTVKTFDSVTIPKSNFRCFQAENACSTSHIANQEHTDSKTSFTLSEGEAASGALQA